jgi:hypothetical protein
VSLTYFAFQSFVAQDLLTIRPVGFLSFSPSLSTSTSTFADVTGASFSFTKQETNSQLTVVYGASPYCQTAASQVQFRVSSAAGVTQFRTRVFDDLNVRDFVSCVAQHAPSTAAQALTLKLQWRRNSGTGTIVLDSNSRVYFGCVETRYP